MISKDDFIIQTVDRKKSDTRWATRAAREGLAKFRESAMKSLYEDDE